MIEQFDRMADPAGQRVKACAHCKHSVRVPGSSRWEYLCGRTGLEYHVVTGKAIGPTCEEKRRPEQEKVCGSVMHRPGNCGVSGKFWEAKK